MAGGANFPGIETASSKKDAVKKAFNQEYQATMKAMANAADRARKQILDQKLAAASHGQSNQPSQNGTPSTGPGPTSPKIPGAPSGAEATPSDPTVLVMIEIANELRRIIVSEIDMRMNHLANQVEQAIAHSLPQSSESQAAANTQPATGTTDTTTTSTATQAPAATTPAPPPATAPAPATASESTTNATATPNAETASTAANSPAQPQKIDTTSDKNPPNSDG
ncbi:hypothetical protein [Thalassospira alkalitolerans]|uniref:hypothetical protein n=1 Tax=Thalassospira alkalitolerans TaxID=1293890 RepID=UPI0030EC9822|tara:strand:- start:67749 stop:68420 length:672 start_codon:yes stop_codon:yes gene_type:complete